MYADTLILQINATLDKTLLLDIDLGTYISLALRDMVYYDKLEEIDEFLLRVPVEKLSYGCLLTILQRISIYDGTFVFLNKEYFKEKVIARVSEICPDNLKVVRSY